MTEPEEWRLHIGIHKTATTHVQDVLERSRPDLAAQDTTYIPVERFRDLFRLHWQRYRKGRWWERTLWWQGRRLRQALLAEVPAGTRRVVISDENILGDSGHLLRSPAYPVLEPRLALLRAALQGQSVRLYVSLRSPDRVIPGAYITALRFGLSDPEDLARRLAMMQETPPRWGALIGRIETALPGWPLQIWTQEEYREAAGEILSAFCGVGIGAAADLQPPTRTMTPSAQGVAEAEALAATLPRDLAMKERRKQIDAVFEAHPPGPQAPRYTCFEPSDAARLADLYGKDLENLAPSRLSGVLGPQNRQDA